MKIHGLQSSSLLYEKSQTVLLSADSRNQRLSMQTNELEMLSRRIREAEERLRRVEEEGDEVCSVDRSPLFNVDATEGEETTIESKRECDNEDHESLKGNDRRQKAD